MAALGFASSQLRMGRNRLECQIHGLAWCGWANFWRRLNRKWQIPEQDGE